MRKRSAFYACFVFLTLGTFALAQAAAAPAAPAAAGAAPSLWTLVLKGLLGGVIAVFIGKGAQQKLADGTEEDFDWGKAVVTILTGGVVGLIAGLQKMDVQNAINQFEAAPLFPILTLGLEYVFKILARKVPFLKNLLNLDPKSVLDSLKGGSTTNPTGSAPGTPPKP